jgi:hypothetical protein
MTDNKDSKPDLEAKAARVKVLDSAIIVVIMTAIAYVLAFQFDNGYLGYFGLPTILAEVSLRNLLFSLWTTMVFILLVINGMTLLLVSWPYHWPAIVQRYVASYVGMTLMTVFILGLLGAPLLAWLISFGAIAFLAIVYLVLPLAHSASTYAGKLQALEDVNPFFMKGLPPALQRRGFPVPLLWITGCLLAFMYADIYGTLVARTQSSFLVSASGGGTVCAVLRVRDQGLLCADFDPATKQMKGEYRFLKPDAVGLSLRNTGRPRAPDASTSTSLAPDAPALRPP